MNIKTSNYSLALNVIVSLLLTVGVIAIYSATFTAQTISEGKGTANKQLIFIFIGLVIYVFLSKVDYKTLSLFPVKVTMYTILLGFLILVLFSEPVRGTNRWITIGFFNIQPSEYSKVVLILINGYIFSRNPSDFGKLKTKIASILYYVRIPYFIIEKFIRLLSDNILKLIISAIVTIPVLTLVYIQPALGNTLIITSLWIGMYLVSVGRQIRYISYFIILLLGVNSVLHLLIIPDMKPLDFAIISSQVSMLIIFIAILYIFLSKHFLKTSIIISLLFLIGGITTAIGSGHIWQNTKDYQKARIIGFLDPDNESSADHWQVNQSKIAIGSGQFTGKGFLKGSQSKLKYLPFAYTDFIFASISEEFGFIGSLFVLALFLALLLLLLITSSKTQDNFGAVLLLGFFIMFLLHIFVNVGMNMGLMPVTGIPLPLISYGGNSVLVNLISLGIAQSIISRNMAVDTKRQMVITSESLWGIRSF